MTENLQPTNAYLARHAPTRPVLALISLAGMLGTVYAAPSVYPTGVTRYDPAVAYNCDVLFSAADHKTYLIDMNGNVIHRWDHEGFPSRMLDPALVNGVKGEVGLQLTAASATPASGPGVGLIPGQPAQFRNSTFGFVDWGGQIAWQWGGEQAPGGAARQHHDWARLTNGDTLILANRSTRLKGFGTRKMLDDVIYEVAPSGRIVWTWAASQHLAEFGFTRTQLDLLMSPASAADYLHMNSMQVLGPNHWEQSGDARFAPENIMISSRNSNFIAIISRKSGNITWRLGPNFTQPKEFYAPPPQGRRSLPHEIDQFSGQHDAHMIPEGLPGAGNILMFDNQGEGGYPPAATPMIAGSRVLEIDPVKDLVVWEYGGTKFTFFSPYISSAQRLPNGNTLIDEGIDGRFFQVTQKGEIVWEYVSPFLDSAAPAAGDGSPPIDYAVYRIQGVPYAWVPEQGPHSQIPVHAPARAEFHVRDAE
jgi:hypothetical protein